MKIYKVCVSTSKHSGKVIASLTRIIEDESDNFPADYSLENERYYFDYHFFDTEEGARKYLEGVEK